MKTKIYILSVFLFILMISCNTDETCRKSRTVTAGISFYGDSINKTTGKRVQYKLVIDSLWVNGIGVDSLLYKKARTGSVTIPLNQFAEESKFRMKINNIIDTITVQYKNKIEFLSLECGSIRTHTIDTVMTTGHFIDSVALNNPIVNTISVENIQLHHNK
ncbi:MAG: DUF6452 family protein [Paludibacteraceae bacterium]